MHLINAYDGKYRIVSFAKQTIVANELLGNDLSVLLLKSDCIVFPVEDCTFEISKDLFALLDKFNNYDVLEVLPNGRLNRLYDSTSEDNGFVITSKCNSNCVMCPSPESARRNGHSANIESLMELAKHIPCDTPHITITGGEPFIIGDDIFRLFQYLKNQFHSTEFLLLTNGRIFSSPFYCKELKRTLPENTIIGIPIHGHIAKIHDEITRSDGSFDQTITGIKNLLSLGLKVEIRIVVSKLNVSYIDAICNLIKTELSNVCRVKIVGLEMLGNAALNAEKVWIPYHLAFLAAKNGIKSLLLAGIDVGIYNFPLCAVDKSYWSIYEKSISDYKIRFSKLCETCSLMSHCGGIFSGTMRYAEQDVVPYGE